jgi:hypothetical protein
MSPRQALQELLRLLSGKGRRPSEREGIAALRQLVTAALRGNMGALPSSVRTILGAMERGGGNLGSAPSGSSLGSAGSPSFSFRPGEPPTRPPGDIVKSQGPGPLDRRPKYFPEGRPDERDMFSDEFLAPSSSNVYSFQYFRRPHDKNGILFITFKAASLNKDALSVGKARRKGGRRQLHGIAGYVHTGGKQNAPGSTYAYFGVAPNLFTRMKMAHSKGKFVWDSLRVRGTVYGHQYRYQLVVGQLVEGVPGGQALQYIPRKATPRGFVTRAVSDIGTGRRGFISSTLPESVGGGGFSTRRR